MKTSPGRPLLRTVAVVLIAGLGVTACSSKPSAQRVAEDLINTCMQESNPCDLTEEQLSDPDAARECMNRAVEAIGKDELDQIGEDAESGDQAEQEAANAELDKLQAELEACME